MYRKIYDNPISHKPNYISVWLYLLIHANHKNNELILDGKLTLIKRGQLLTSIRKIADWHGISTSNVIQIISYLKHEHMIERTSTRKYTIVTIQNYDTYQVDEHLVENKKNTERTLRELNNNDKNVKNNTKNSITRKERDTDIDFILQTFEKYMGHKPTDRYVRNIAFTFKRQVISFIAEIAPYRPGLEFKGLIEKSFDWYCQANEQVKGRTLDSIRRNVVNVLFDKTRKKYQMKGGVTT